MLGRTEKQHFRRKCHANYLFIWSSCTMPNIIILSRCTQKVLQLFHANLFHVELWPVIQCCLLFLSDFQTYRSPTFEYISVPTAFIAMSQHTNRMANLKMGDVLPYGNLWFKNKELWGREKWQGKSFCCWPKTSDHVVLDLPAALTESNTWPFPVFSDTTKLRSLLWKLLCFMKKCSNLLDFYFCFRDEGKSLWIQVIQVQNMTGWRTEKLWQLHTYFLMNSK